MAVMILISALTSVFIIAAFAGGVLLGLKLSLHSDKRSRTGFAPKLQDMTEEEQQTVTAIKQRIKEDNEAFKAMMGYNQGMAYGMHGKDGELK